MEVIFRSPGSTLEEILLECSGLNVNQVFLSWTAGVAVDKSGYHEGSETVSDHASDVTQASPFWSRRRAKGRRGVCCIKQGFHYGEYRGGAGGRAAAHRLVAIRDPRCPLLESIPAIGPLDARVVVSALDAARRFDDQKVVANYRALAPTIYQSGEVLQLGHINRDGRGEVRRVLLQCAHTVVRIKRHGAKPLRQFYARIARRRGKKIAVVALTRKLLTTAYAC